MDKHVLETTKYYHPLYYCSFCHKEYVEKEPMILGPDVSMCYECLEIAAKEISCPWTTEPPRKEGWYWYNNDDLEIPTIVRIEVHERFGLGVNAFEGFLGFVHVKELAEEDGARFKGPLRPER